MEVIGVTEYELKAEKDIGYKTIKGLSAKSRLTMQSRVYDGGYTHGGYGRGR